MANTIDIDVGDSLLVGPRGPQGEIGPRGYGVKTITKTGSNKLVDTYTVTFDDNRTATFEVTNGKGIASIDLTSTVENVDTYTITYNDETTSTFTVTNSNVSREEFEEALELTNSEMDDGLEEGEDVQLTGVAKTDLDITVCGNTKQETTEGYNLIDSSSFNNYENYGIIAIKNPDGSIRVTGTATRAPYVDIVLETNKTLEAGNYVINGVDGGSTSSLAFRLVIPGVKTLISQTNGAQGFTLSETEEGVTARLDIYEGVTVDITLYPLLYKGTNLTKPYEPYTGNLPSPNPDFPQEVKVVTGENVVSLSGKNKLELKENVNSGITSEINKDGSISYNGTASQNYCQITPFIEKELQIGTYTFSRYKVLDYKTYINCKFEDESQKNYIIGTGKVSTTFTTEKKIIAYKIVISDLTLNQLYNDTLYLQLEEGSATDYEPYIGANYPLSLGTLELCKIGDYKDYFHKDNGKWFKHKEIEKVVLDGSESWSRNSSIDTFYINLSGSLVANGISTTISNYFANCSFNNRSIGSNARTYIDNHLLQVKKSGFSDTTTFKTWLGTHNLIVYYILATPTEVEITDTTLIQQLEALNKATAKGNNFIVTTETDGVKPILKVQYKESARAKADDLEERVETLENQIKGAGHVYGIKRKRVDNSSSEWERTDDSIGLVANATHDGTEVQNDFDNLSPWKDIISFNLDLETGKKKAYYGDPDFKFDGSNGDVYTHIPDIYYKVWQDEDYDYVQIADFAKTGFTKCDAFDIQRYKSGEVDGTLHSYSGLVPAGYNGIEYFREKTKTNLGENYCLLDWRYFVIQLLYLVEYADYNAQSKLGNGFSGMRKKATDVSLLAENNTHRFVVNVTGGNAFIVGQTISIGTTGEKHDIADSRKITAISDYDSDGVVGKSITFNGRAITTTITSVIWSGAQHCGQCDSLGMKSGCLVDDAKHEVIYRGIEDLYGNITQNIDGINIRDRQAYVCYNPDDYVSDKFETPYEPIGYIDVDTNGYIKTLGFDTNNPLIRLPIEAGGSTQTYITDYSAQNPGDRVVRVGGTLENGAYNGPWYYTLSGAKSSAGWNNGARVIKYK